MHAHTIKLLYNFSDRLNLWPKSAEWRAKWALGAKWNQKSRYHYRSVNATPSCSPVHVCTDLLSFMSLNFKEQFTSGSVKQFPHCPMRLLYHKYFLPPNWNHLHC